MTLKFYRDHPRVCGEKLMSSISCSLDSGSPPRMRGKAYDEEHVPYGERITPAYAGKRALERSGRAAVGDHPRVCGEKTKKIP